MPYGEPANVGGRGGSEREESKVSQSNGRVLCWIDAQTRAGDRQLMLVSDNTRTRTRPSGVSEGSKVAR